MAKIAEGSCPRENVLVGIVRGNVRSWSVLTEKRACDKTSTIYIFLKESLL